MTMYFLAFAVLIAAAAGLVMNRVKPFSPTFDGAALVLIGGVFGFLIAAILIQPSSVPRLVVEAPHADVAPAAAAATAAADAAPGAGNGAPAAAKVTSIGFRSGGALRSSQPPMVPAGSPLVALGAFDRANDAAHAASAKIDADQVTAKVDVRGTDFDVEIPTANVMPGTHTVGIVFHTSGGADRTLQPFGVVVVSPSAAAPPAATGPAPDASVDTFGDLAAPPQRNLSVSVGRTAFVLMQGWAFDNVAHRPASDVLVGVDGKTFYRATTGQRRPDVAQARSAPYLTSGFTAVLPAADLSAGHHDVALMVVSGGVRHALPLGLALEVR